MKPFDRGMAWGGFWLGLVGAGQGGAKFLQVIKVRLPKKFTNPFRPAAPELPMTAKSPGLNVVPEMPVALKTPKIEIKIPHETIPRLKHRVPARHARANRSVSRREKKPGAGSRGAGDGRAAPARTDRFQNGKRTMPASRGAGDGRAAPARTDRFQTGKEPMPAPEAPGAGAPRPREPIGFKTGKEPVSAPEAPAPEVPAPETPGAPQPKRVGFRFPHEKNVAVETPSKAVPEGEVVSSRLHHRKPAAPETPGAGKRRIGFVSSEEPAPIGRADAPEAPLPAGENSRRSPHGSSARPARCPARATPRRAPVRQRIGLRSDRPRNHPARARAKQAPRKVREGHGGIPPSSRSRGRLRLPRRSRLPPRKPGSRMSSPYRRQRNNASRPRSASRSSKRSSDS